MQFSVNIKLHSYCYTFFYNFQLWSVRLNVFGSLLCNTWSSQQFSCSCFVLRSSTPWPWRIGTVKVKMSHNTKYLCQSQKLFPGHGHTYTISVFWSTKVTSNNIHTFVQPYVVTLEAVTYLTSGLSVIRSVR